MLVARTNVRNLSIGESSENLYPGILHRSDPPGNNQVNRTY